MSDERQSPGTSRDSISPKIDALARADRLEEAAKLAGDRGRHAQAAGLWERACRWDNAALSALRAGDGPRALVFAARARRTDLEATAIEAVLSAGQARTAASLCERAGLAIAAGRVMLAAGMLDRAAPLFERGGAWLDAGAAYERAGARQDAQRCYERALTADAHSDEARIRLGSLLVERAPETAAALLQGIPPTAADYPRALLLLERALARLGLHGAAVEVGRRRAALGTASIAAPAPSVAPDPDPSETVLFGRYNILARVATTPTAKVYHARDVLTDAEVAVKVFSIASLRDTGRDALKRFEREAQILGGLRHPAIVPLVDYVPQGPAVVLRWMAGGSLADLFAAGPLAPARAAEIVAAVLAALAEAHRRGILHRDIKPANVLFDAAGAAYLADFGTAHVSDSAATVTSGIIGTLAYMAPEQRAGRPATVKSDIYGAGALFWHALTGAPPDARLPVLSREVGAELVAAAERLIASPDERPETASDARDLVAALEWPRRAPPRKESPSPVTPTTVAPPAERWIPAGEHRYLDRLLGRPVLLLDATPELLRRALPFARADHPALASILAFDAASNSLWIEALDRRPLSRLAAPEELAELAEALGRLHRAGGVHGGVDRANVAEQGGMLRLAFVADPGDATPADDLANLEKLAKPSSGLQ